MGSHRGAGRRSHGPRWRDGSLLGPVRGDHRCRRAPVRDLRSSLARRQRRGAGGPRRGRGGRGDARRVAVHARRLRRHPTGGALRPSARGAHPERRSPGGHRHHRRRRRPRRGDRQCAAVDCRHLAKHPHEPGARPPGWHRPDAAGRARRRGPGPGHPRHHVPQGPSGQRRTDRGLRAPLTLRAGDQHHVRRVAVRAAGVHAPATQRLHLLRVRRQDALVRDDRPA